MNNEQRFHENHPICSVIILVVITAVITAVISLLISQCEKPSYTVTVQNNYINGERLSTLIVKNNQNEPLPPMSIKANIPDDGVLDRMEITDGEGVIDMENATVEFVVASLGSFEVEVVSGSTDAATTFSFISPSSTTSASTEK